MKKILILFGLFGVLMPEVNAQDEQRMPVYQNGLYYKNGELAHRQYYGYIQYKANFEQGKLTALSYVDPARDSEGDNAVSMEAWTFEQMATEVEGPNQADGLGISFFLCKGSGKFGPVLEDTVWLTGHLSLRGSQKQEILADPEKYPLTLGLFDLYGEAILLKELDPTIPPLNLNELVAEVGNGEEHWVFAKLQSQNNDLFHGMHGEDVFFRLNKLNPAVMTELKEAYHKLDKNLKDDEDGMMQRLQFLIKHELSFEASQLFRVSFQRHPEWLNVKYYFMTLLPTSRNRK